MENETQYTIKLAESQWNVILEAQQELPAKIANPITNSIQWQARQIIEQRAAQDEAAKQEAALAALTKDAPIEDA